MLQRLRALPLLPLVLATSFALPVHAAVPARSKSTPSPELLPQEFDGWRRVAVPVVSDDAQTADEKNADVLK